MAGNKRELILDLLARDKTGPATRRAADNLEDVGDAADKAGTSVGKFGRETEVAEDATEEFGNAATSAKRDVAALDKQIDGLNRELVELHRKYAHAADEMERRDLAKGIRKADAEIRRLGKSRGVLAGLIPDGSAAGGFAAGLRTAIAGAGSAAGPAIAGAALAAAPLIGGAIAGAVVGAAGMGGIIGGVTLAARDPRVKVAGAALGRDLLADLEDRAEVMVQPLLAGIGDVRKAWGSIGKDLDRLFGAGSKMLQPLVKDALYAGKRIVSGVADAAEKSGPVVAAVGDAVRNIGDATGRFFTGLGEHADAAAIAIKDLGSAAATTITATGQAVGWLAEAYGWAKKIAEFDVTGATNKHREAADKAAETEARLAAEAAMAGEALRRQGIDAAEAAERIQKMEQAQQDLLAANRQLYGSEADVAGAIADTTSKIKENGKGLDLNTKRGRENQQALSTLAGTLRSNFDAYVKVNGAGHGAQEVLKRNREAFIRAATAAGMAASKARDLANKLLGIPEKINPVITLSTNGTTKAQQVKRLLDGIHSKTVSVDVLVNASRLDKVNNTLSRMGGGRGLEARATGGPVRKGQPYVVGEKRPELFVPESNGMILPSVPRGRTGGGSTAGGVTVNVYAHPTSNPADIGREVARTLDAYYRNGGKRP